MWQTKNNTSIFKKENLEAKELEFDLESYIYDSETMHTIQ
jgi:hypothetical protein